MRPTEDLEAPYAPFESYGTFNEFSRVVTKHVLGGQERFNELKQRLEMCEHANSKAGAAALGYLIAMEEKNDGKETIYDLVLEQVENDAVDSMNRTDSIFTVIYKWLDEKFAEDGLMILKEGAKCEKIARTGRVESWLQDPESRLPASCTTFVVEDSMEGPNGIEASWRFVSHGLRNGAGVSVHLSKLRPQGEENGKGLTASGPCSFGKIYSTLNEILRRGGRFKNGAVVLHLDYNHEDLFDFITASRAELPWAKRCVNVEEGFLDKLSPKTIEALIKGISNGDIWLIKKRFNAKGERIYGNVCLEVFLPSRGTCLLQHINLGACSIEDIDLAFVEGMIQLCELHPHTGVGNTGEYLSPDNDKQVGLGMLGLANFLAIHKISYKDFGEALDACLIEDPHPWCHYWCDQPAGKAVAAIAKGITDAAAVARAHGMERAFCIAPTASCSYRYLDTLGFTTAPEIAPPIGRIVDRDSGTFGVEQFDYGNVEIAAEVGWDTFKKVANGIVALYQRSGLFHGYSYNTWGDCVVYDQSFIEDWLESPQTSIYYSVQVLPDQQRKDDAYAALDDDFKTMFGFNDEAEGNAAACDISAGFCSSCAE
jgi:hypothetical protein